MLLEWNERKRLANIRKHGIDFADALEFEWQDAHVELDDRFDYGEERLAALGFYRGKVHMIVYAERGSAKRIISFRKATRREAKTYEEKVRPQ